MPIFCGMLEGAWQRTWFGLWSSPSSRWVPVKLWFCTIQTVVLRPLKTSFRQYLKKELGVDVGDRDFLPFKTLKKCPRGYGSFKGFSFDSKRMSLFRELCMMSILVWSQRWNRRGRSKLYFFFWYVKKSSIIGKNKKNLVLNFLLFCII